MLLLALLAKPDLSDDSAYSIKTVTRIARPYDVQAMNDEFQRARLLHESDGVGTFEITYFPLHKQVVGSNSNWRLEDAKMVAYLKPRPAANWDADLRAKILAELSTAGIDPNRLDDRTLVQQVSNWAIRRSTFNDQFGLWMVRFQGGTPTVAPGLRTAFRLNEPRGVGDKELFDREVFGKAMVENRTHGACTSTSIYMATILRALGIPTRIILTVPAFDANDPKQVRMISSGVRHNLARRTILRGNAHLGFSNHVFNEVWVGRKWVRLNYNRLGQSVLDQDYEGLMTHVYTAGDISEIPFATTWGARYAGLPGPKLSSENPYELLSARDVISAGAKLDNPPLPELKQATIVQILPKGDSAIPSWVRLQAGTGALFCIREWIKDDDYRQLREFERNASAKFTLRSPGHPDIPAELTGEKFSAGSGKLQGFGVRLLGKLTSGTIYQVIADNKRHAKTWGFASSAISREP